MSKELLKLRSVLDGFKRDRCQFNMAQKIFQSINCIVSELQHTLCKILKRSIR